MLILIDNYDSFTYNLVHYFQEIGQSVKVFRNDEISVELKIMNEIETNIASKKIDFNAKLPVQLKVESYNNNYRFYYALKNDDFQLLSETSGDLLLSNGYTGAHIGLYATGNGKESTDMLILIGLNINL